MTVRRQVSYLLLALLLLAPIDRAFAAQQELILPGNQFPELKLTTPIRENDRGYLQINTASFTPSQIPAELLLVELLNVHCPHCQMQTPSYNELFKQIEADSASRGKIKILGIAAGNTAEEVEKFRRNYHIEFPILADPQFTAWHQLGRRQAEVAADRRQAQQLLLPFSADELEYRLRRAFIRFGVIMDFSELELASGRKVYTAYLRGEQGNLRLFAEVASRSSVCDICHDVHFLYLFNKSGRVVQFEPLQLTKYGNVNWNPQEVEFMRQRLTGNYLSMPQPFDPKIDAISSATMTSAIIFDSLAQGEELLQELRTKGLL